MAESFSEITANFVVTNRILSLHRTLFTFLILFFLWRRTFSVFFVDDKVVFARSIFPFQWPSVNIIMIIKVTIMKKKKKTADGFVYLLTQRYTTIFAIRQTEINTSCWQNYVTYISIYTSILYVCSMRSFICPFQTIYQQQTLPKNCGR